MKILIRLAAGGVVQRQTSPNANSPPEEWPYEPSADSVHHPQPAEPASPHSGAPLARPLPYLPRGCWRCAGVREQAKIAISKRWSRGRVGPTKARKSEGHVPLHPSLAYHLKEWLAQTSYAKDTDFIFPSLKTAGPGPVSPAVFVADHLRPAAIKAGVRIEKGQRFGLHDLWHSLARWLLNQAKVEPKTVQGTPRHSKIQTTLDLYTREDSDEARAAQGQFLEALKTSGTIQ